MRYSIEPRFRKYFGNKYGKRLMDTATKAGIDAAKATSNRIVQKTSEATGHLIGNKIAHKISSIGKPREKETKKKKNRRNLYSTRKKTTNY